MDYISVTKVMLNYYCLFNRITVKMQKNSIALSAWKSYNDSCAGMCVCFPLESWSLCYKAEFLSWNNRLLSSHRHTNSTFRIFPFYHLTQWCYVNWELKIINTVLHWLCPFSQLYYKKMPVSKVESELHQTKVHDHCGLQCLYNRTVLYSSAVLYAAIWLYTPCSDSRLSILPFYLKLLNYEKVIIYHFP